MSTMGFNLQKLLADPNVQNLLAGVGTRLDPEGAGGALGGATTQLVQSRAAQTALAGQERQRSASNLLQLAATAPEPEQAAYYRNKAIEMLGDFTPKGQPGVTAVKMGPAGELNFSIDPPGLQPLNQQGPVSSETPAATTGATTSTPTSVAPQRPRTNLSNIVPF